MLVPHAKGQDIASFPLSAGEGLRVGRIESARPAHFADMMFDNRKVQGTIFCGHPQLALHELLVYLNVESAATHKAQQRQ